MLVYIERKKMEFYDAFKLFNSSGLCKNIIGALCKILNVNYFIKLLVNNFDNRLIIIIRRRRTSILLIIL